MNSGITWRHKAAERISDEIAWHLSNPDNLAYSKNSDPLARASLASGFPGISLIYTARLHKGDKKDGATAHWYLKQAAESLKLRSRLLVGLHYDACGLGYALSMAQAVGGGYVGALTQLDAEVTMGAEALCQQVESISLGPMARFDVLDGLAGIARYLLLRDPHGHVLERVLTCLSRMLTPADYFGCKVPGFWSTTPPNWLPQMNSDVRENGHLNLGLAHGIAGPLAVLSTAFLQKIAVPGQDVAIAGLVEILHRFQGIDEYGIFWPNYVSLEEFTTPSMPRSRSRVSWCYGAPGVSRALQLAGKALDRDDWLQTAQSSVSALCAVPSDEWLADHWSFCHGLSGIMHILRYFIEGQEADQVSKLVDSIAERIIEVFSEGLPTGFEVGMMDLSPGKDPAGLLEGVAGLGLALQSYAEQEDSIPWDTAFLMQ
ncbi:lanthionine synthetase C family protein [Streptomyces sp. HD]|uniref:lanthionine synthetase C family protein n=1 Tax=Streptomyces sp. HD TaxID=3020892 RepID=UPI00232A9ED9|nr:lanthionine synthetase C family protein [Streptomyces sp. HD]MDC0772866.1 lanthionine synthetase C family protein [Streptomyces sp. HD]